MKTLQLFGIISTIILLACSRQNPEESHARIPVITTTDRQTEITASLDGRTFITDFFEEGVKGESSKDTLRFANGTCHSTMCDEYGFSKASYAVSKEGENLTFTATTVSDVDGEMLWRGIVTGKRIAGNVVWNKEGQSPITYRFEGALQ